MLVIGGGYEPDQDNDVVDHGHDGNAIYIVDSDYGQPAVAAAATTGATKNFATTGRAMDYSIPARIRVRRLRRRRLADRMYAGDMGGQVWRFDITNGQRGREPRRGRRHRAARRRARVIAGARADTRRFYYSARRGHGEHADQNFIHVGIGSGHRGHPLEHARTRIGSTRCATTTIGPMTQTQFNALTPITDAALDACHDRQHDA